MKESSSSSQHTGGPWTTRPHYPESAVIIEQPDEESNGGWRVATCWGADAEANARLIASAPDLLQMLEEIAALQIDVPGYNSPSALFLRLAHMQSLARGGIEKAKGTA